MLTKFRKFLNSKSGINSLFVLIFIFLFILELNNVGLSLREKISLDQTLDFSWFTDSIERFLHGFIQGRDFTFTYGPLFQFAYSFPSIIFNIPSYISVAISPLISFIILFLLVLRSSKIITKNHFEQISYIVFLFLILGLIISNSDLVRIMMFMYYSLELSRLFEKKIKWPRYFIVALLPTVLGLFSYNLFIIALLFSLIFISFKLYPQIKNRNFSRSLLWFIPSVIALQLVFSILFTHNLDYIINSLDSVSNYRYVMDLTWTRDRSNLLIVFPLLLVFFGAYLLKTKKVLQETREILLILILSSFVGLISVLSRSDVGHLLFAIYPSIITFFTVIFFLSKKFKWLILLAFFFYILVPVKPNFYNTLAPKNVFKVFKVIKDKPSFYDIYKLPATYFSTEEIKSLSKIIKENKKSMFIYPYDSYLMNIENATYNSFALGLYTYSNSLAEEKTVTGLSKNPPKIIILEIDTKGALNLDDIPNFTRNPLIAKWIIENYKVLQKNPKYVVLKYSPGSIRETSINKCSYSVLTINLSKKENPIQKVIDLIKPPLYYIGDMRLPYAPWSKNYFIFNDVYSVSGVTSLFNADVIYQSRIFKDKKLQITRVSPFLGKKEIKSFSDGEYSIKCQ